MYSILGPDFEKVYKQLVKSTNMFNNMLTVFNPPALMNSTGEYYYFAIDK